MGGRGRIPPPTHLAHQLLYQGGCADGEGEGGEEGSRDLPEPGEIQKGGRKEKRNLTSSMINNKHPNIGGKLSDCCQGNEG